MKTAVGLIAFIVIGCLAVAAYPAIFGSMSEDSAALNRTGNNTVVQGNNVGQGFMGLTEGAVYIAVILLIIVVLLLMFVI